MSPPNEDNLHARRIVQQAHNIAKASLASTLERICYEIGTEQAFAEMATERGGDASDAGNESRMTSEEILFALRHLVEKGTLTMSQAQQVLDALIQIATRPEGDACGVQAKAAEIVETAKRVAGELGPPRI